MNHFLKTFNQENKKIPIWFMRQAGRYMPEYMKVRGSVDNFLELCYDSNKAAEVTLQPINKFGFDAAIIFSDILVLPHALGWDVSFKQGEGPVLRKFESSNDFSLLNENFSSKIGNIYETVSKVKASLPKDVALIGFAGSPWTVVSYMLEGKGKQDFSVSKSFLYNQTETAKKLIDVIAEKTIEYLSGQIDAGAEVIQLFDSWSGMLNETQYDEFVINPTIKIVSAIKDKYPSIPVIGFPKGSGYNYEKYIRLTGINGVGVDQFTPVSEMNKWQKNIVVQGNLDPVVLLGDKDNIKKAADKILSNMDTKNFIFNLGHGILPTTPVENVEYLVNYVRNYQK
ncbi:MAG: uroporphyrinogen decarboxylase [Rickettsiaceae bacterium]|nr:uroporphyrinogen decarboxylase [Rickettsiaceae bacterium]MDP4832624.1 uroporphyrinogen decarboxylase [Rickettsiaceae bacterium]MDP5021246.1 uroporphyrinogen decarboxylase [Rickettsiaceae bacterium]MDP5083179.1 uroporphyrinogen decarboxylase [Rickettsiaceae bacterium]